MIFVIFLYLKNTFAKTKGQISNEMWEQIWSKSAVTTIEHIHPQSPSNNWSGKLGRGRNQLEKNVNRIGNLLLLPRISIRRRGKNLLKKENLQE